MRITSHEVEVEHPRPVLVADSTPQLVAIVRDALDALSQQHALMVIPQTAELRQYLEASLLATRTPVAIVLSLSDPAMEALVAWIRLQRNVIAEIPIVAVGGGPDHPHLNQIDAAVQSPTAALLGSALRRVMKQPSLGGP